MGSSQWSYLSGIFFACLQTSSKNQQTNKLVCTNASLKVVRKNQQRLDAKISENQEWKERQWKTSLSGKLLFLKF
jgi:hypothetical protein